MTSITLADLTAEHFSGQIGKKFTVRHPDHSEALTLEKIDDSRRSPDKSRFRDPFSLFFRGESTNVMLNQQTHSLENETLGQLDIFVTPIGRNEDGSFRYQAVFT